MGYNRKNRERNHRRRGSSDDTVDPLTLKTRRRRAPNRPTAHSNSGGSSQKKERRYQQESQVNEPRVKQSYIDSGYAVSGESVTTPVGWFVPSQNDPENTLDLYVFGQLWKTDIPMSATVTIVNDFGVPVFLCHESLLAQGSIDSNGNINMFQPGELMLLSNLQPGHNFTALSTHAEQVYGSSTATEATAVQSTAQVAQPSLETSAEILQNLREEFGDFSSAEAVEKSNLLAQLPDDNDWVVYVGIETDSLYADVTQSGAPAVSQADINLYSYLRDVVLSRISIADISAVAGQESEAQTSQAQTTERRTADEQNAPEQVTNLSIEDQYAELFERLVIQKALSQLSDNRQLVLSERENVAGSSAEEVERLRQLVEKDDELASHQRELTAQRNVIQSNQPLDEAREAMAELHGQQDLLEGQPTAAEESERLAVTDSQLETVVQVRQALRIQDPAVGVLKPKDVSAARSDQDVRNRTVAGFDRILEFIDKVEVGLYEGDIPLVELGPIVSQALVEMDEPGRVYVQAYVEAEKRRERNNSYISLAAEVGLTIGAIFASGGLALLLAGLGTVVGASNAAYELERADDLRSAANAGVAGNEFVDDPDAARFNYTMAWANLALAAVDVGLTVREIAPSTQRTFLSALNESGDASAVASMSAEQIGELSEIFRLHAVGDTNAAQRLLDKLKAELGLSMDGLDAAFDQLFGWSGRQPQPAIAEGSISRLADDRQILQSRADSSDFGNQSMQIEDSFGGIQSDVIPSRVSNSSALVNVEEHYSDSFGHWFSRFESDGTDSFSARLLYGTAELEIGWTENVRQLADNIAEIQDAIGEEIVRITGLASDGIEKAIISERFNSQLYAQHISRRLGGEWSIEVIPKAGNNGWDIIANRV